MADTENDIDETETPIVQEEVERRHTLASERKKPPLLESVLMKQGGNFKNWKKRFFVLLDDSITYFDQAGGKIRGGILMENVQDVRVSTATETKKPFSFTIVTKARNYFQHASSEEERDSWIQSILKVAPKVSQEETTTTNANDEPAQTTDPSTSKSDVADSTEASPSDEKFYVHYWPNFLGRIGSIALLLNDAEANWEKIEDASQFVYAGGNTDYPVFAVPALVHKGKTIGQSLAALRYAGQVLGYDLPDPVDSARCFQLALQAYDFITETAKAVETQDAADTFCNDRMPKILSTFEKQLAFTDGSYFFGDKPCWAEFQLFDTLLKVDEIFESNKSKDLPENLKRWFLSMGERPNLKSYLAGDPQNTPPFMIGIKSKKKLDKCILTYFPIPGRGEPVRIALTMGGIDFSEGKVENWPALKPTTPWGGLPTLQLADGTMLSQGRAILRFVGQETGLYPKDHLQAEKCDELLDVMDDMIEVIMSTGKGLEDEAKANARKEAVTSEDGSLFKMLKNINNFIDTNGSDGHAVGKDFTIGDVAVFHLASNLVCGFWDGVPENSLDGFENIKAVRNKTGSHAKVSEYYANAEGPYLAYKIGTQ